MPETVEVGAADESEPIQLSAVSRFPRRHEKLTPSCVGAVRRTEMRQRRPSINNRQSVKTLFLREAPACDT